MHRWRYVLDSSTYPSIIKAGKVRYHPNHVLELENATIESHDERGIYSNKKNDHLVIMCKGTNVIKTTGRANAIYAADDKALGIVKRDDNKDASLELLPSTVDNFVGIWDASKTSKKDLDIDLKIKSKGAGIYTPLANKSVNLKNVTASLTNSGFALISGFKTLRLEDCYIASPAGAVVDGGVIKHNGTTLSNTTCEIKRGNAPL